MEDFPINADEQQLIELYGHASPDRRAFIIAFIAALGGARSLEKALKLAPTDLRAKIIE